MGVVCVWFRTFRRRLVGRQATGMYSWTDGWLEQVWKELTLLPFGILPLVVVLLHRFAHFAWCVVVVVRTRHAFTLPALAGVRRARRLRLPFTAFLTPPAYQPTFPTPLIIFPYCCACFSRLQPDLHCPHFTPPHPTPLTPYHGLSPTHTSFTTFTFTICRVVPRTGSLPATLSSFAPSVCCLPAALILFFLHRMPFLCLNIIHYLLCHICLAYPRLNIPQPLCILFLCVCVTCCGGYSSPTAARTFSQQHYDIYYAPFFLPFSYWMIGHCGWTVHMPVVITFYPKTVWLDCPICFPFLLHCLLPFPHGCV